MEEIFVENDTVSRNEVLQAWKGKLVRYGIVLLCGQNIERAVTLSF
jgi:hypothetical protein